ncbi:NupC/NupG family nucleoside CNT transporter [Ketobacter sp.]|uniref:NupC/NupG family nucleoside CNT transporter n=1 Tax=Ketobacter sp. TaxID=2083498 RepID=UPI0025B8C11F|nr:nucleoside transporter C-terminal domain-containing protein [Ketobacter sp.]
MQGQGLIGIVVLLLIAFICSENRKAIPWKTVAMALLLQCSLAIVFLYLPWFQALLRAINRGALAIQQAAEAGSSMVFGYLGGGPLPFAESYPGASFVLAFKALPIVIVMSALSALLFYWKILPAVIRGAAWLLQRSMNVSGAVGVSTAANVFVGMVEAPLCVRPYIQNMTRSELFILMSAGMATVAGTVMVLYATLLGNLIDNALGHVLVASLVSAPAAILFAVMMIPPASTTTANHSAPVTMLSPARSSMDAITYGTEEGLKLFLNILALLLVLVSLVTLLNSALSLLPEFAGGAITLQRLLGWLFAPLMWTLGLPWEEAIRGGQLMGMKTVLNEFLAYLELSQMAPGTFSERSTLILIYALCGFANFGSLGIMVGGLSAMAPQRRGDILQLGARSLVSGTLATCLTGALVGLLV